MSSRKNFWEKQSEHSRIKTEIVVKYFHSWARIMKQRCRQLTYLDLFSGRGAFEDGTPSTPLLILDEVVGDATLQRCLRVFFFESNTKNFQELKSSVENHPAFRIMTFRPDPKQEVIKRDMIRQLPLDDCTFCFIDPFGYRGVSLELLWLVTRNWGCDCVFYLSTSGIERNVRDIKKEAQLKELFGVRGFAALKNELAKPRRRRSFEMAILRGLEDSLRVLGVKYFRSFCVEFEKRRHTSHYLVFITKDSLGFKIMKDVMADYSVEDTDHISQFRYSKMDEQQFPLPFHYSMDDLKRGLCSDFSGQMMSVKQICDKCHELGYVYLDRNVKDALGLLEGEGLVKVDKSRDERRKTKNGRVSLGDKRLVTFRCRHGD